MTRLRKSRRIPSYARPRRAKRVRERIRGVILAQNKEAVNTVADRLKKYFFPSNKESK